MPTNTETRRRQAQSRKDKARDRRDADRNFGCIYARVFRDVRPTQTLDQIKDVNPAMPVRFLGPLCIGSRCYVDAFLTTRIAYTGTS
jgi:hypothetical protein